MKGNSEELEEALDLEYWFDRESRAYKLSRGSSGMQVHCQECPVCGDARWRTYLNAETGRGNCFVCNAKFTKLRFIHAALGGDPDNKADWGRTFKHVREVLGEQGWRPVRRASVAVEHEKAVFPTSFALPTPEGRNLVYLEDRGIHGEIAKYFHLRFCEHGRWWFTDPTSGRKGYQEFDGRVIIPIYDLDGTFVTFQGRDVTGTAQDQKYLFPKGLPGTGRYLLNGQNAVLARHVCMGEGAFDVAAIKIAFDEDPLLRNVVPVGSFGKSLGYGQPDGNDQLGRFLQLKARHLQEVTIMWDGEHKALVAALDAAKLLTGIGLRTRIAVLPADRDPNEVTPDVVRDAFHKARPYSKRLEVEWRLRSPFKAA